MVTLVACCVTECQEQSIRLKQTWHKSGNGKLDELQVID